MSLTGRVRVAFGGGDAGEGGGGAALEGCGEGAGRTECGCRGRFGRSAATPGDYTLEITYAHADECTGECDCEPGPDGGCTLDRETSTLTGTPTRAQARYDGVCTVLDLVID